MLTIGYTTANDFKTATTYKLQAVIVAEDAIDLFRIYIQNIYPLLAKRQPPEFEDPLWLTFDGEREQNIGRMVSKFFMVELKIHITTTTIRSVVETTSARQLEDGVISDAQRAAISVVNTHSSSITRDHYVRTELARTVQLAKEAFAGGEAVPSTPQSPPPQPEVWGVDHPDGPDVQRARWTVAEKQYLRRIYEELFTDATKHRILSLCLRHIKADASSRAIFHVRHVMSTDRLKAGLTVVDEEM